MKFPILILMFLFETALAYAQHTTYMRFRHFGEETKPIGILTVCLTKAVAPLDSSLDSQFGKILITDRSTYKNIKKFITISNKIVYNKKGLSFRNGTFEILMEDKPYGYLNDNRSNSFFRELVKYLKERNGDKTIIEFLYAYVDKS